MSDDYASVRALPIFHVLLALGWNAGAFTVRNRGTEFSGQCPIHESKKNDATFNFHIDGRYQCLSCGAKGKGAVDITMAIRKCGFQEAVNVLAAIDLLPVRKRA